VNSFDLTSNSATIAALPSAITANRAAVRALIADKLPEQDGAAVHVEEQVVLVLGCIPRMEVVLPLKSGPT
jgi:hypothetical protein